MVPKLFLVASAGALLFTGCATTSPQANSRWYANEMSKGETSVTFQHDATLIPLSRGLPHDGYRVVSPKDYAKHHIPAEAKSAFVGRQGRYNYQVFYEIRNAKGGTDLYHFSYGKFDIDLPAKLLARIDSKGEATVVKVVE